MFVVGSGNQVVAQSPTPVLVAPVPAPIPVKPPPIVKRDSDRDGVTDDQDKCPRNTTVEISKGIYKSGSRQGCPIDSDNDRVQDYRDNCPRNSSKEISKGVDSRGCPKDLDQDGIADYQDSCPKTSSGIKVKENGCPIPVPVVSTHSSLLEDMREHSQCTPKFELNAANPHRPIWSWKIDSSVKKCEYQLDGGEIVGEWSGNSNYFFQPDKVLSAGIHTLKVVFTCFAGGKEAVEITYNTYTAQMTLK